MAIDRATLQAHVIRARRDWPFIDDVERQHGLPFGLLFAVGSRETNLMNVVGDSGHGFGVWQRDNRTWDVDRSYLLDVRRQAQDAGDLLADNRRALGTWAAAVAAYNCGPGRVRQAISEGRSVDYYTTGRDYSADVLARRTIIESFGEAPVAWRVARSLEKLRDQINAAFPNRNKASDGTIGDADHQNRNSDHNPWYGPGIVTAMDITHDPAHGVDIDRLTDELQRSRDSRIKYVIANNMIMSGAGGPSPWVWRAYSGSNPHTKHFHLSVVASPACDDTRPWNLPSLKEDDVSYDDAYKAQRDFWTGKWHEPRVPGDQPDVSRDDMLSNVDAGVYTALVKKHENAKGKKYQLHEYAVNTNDRLVDIEGDMASVKSDLASIKAMLQQLTQGQS